MTQGDLIFTGSTVTGRHCSFTGAVRSAPRVGSQCDRILIALGDGAWTRHELAAETGLPITTICARLAKLLKDERIEVAGSKRGPWQARNTTYRRNTT